MSPEQLKLNVRRIIEEAWNQGKFEVMDELYASNYVRHKPPFPDIVGKAEAKKFVSDSRASYPDQHVTIHEQIAEGNKVVTRWTFKGTQTGVSPTTGLPPTGKFITFSGCNVTHWENGQIVEEWEYSDWLVLLQQFGVVPELEMSR
ncbi:MAG: ester cyclase [Chloroflexi bacterium]|nr:MAG: ester cyclase [Chloroflexota bacterium]